MPRRCGRRGSCRRSTPKCDVSITAAPVRAALLLVNAAVSPGMSGLKKKLSGEPSTERCRVDDPVAKRTAIGTIAARDRAWNAHELRPHFNAGEPHSRIAVTAHIHEFKKRRKIRNGKRRARACPRESIPAADGRRQRA